VKKDLKQAFGIALRELREQRELSQQELADYSEIDRTYLSDLERGLSFPTLNVIFKLAEVLEIKPHEIIQKTEKLMH
jgi:transcriptional regulator with XRE-family HTH domain